VHAETEGWLERVETAEIGFGLVRLGGGRQRPDDVPDYTVGFSQIARPGTLLHADAPFCVLHARNEEDWQEVAARLRAALTISAEPTPCPGPVIFDVVRTQDLAPR
jgi:thymidine phosphorylase